MFKFNRSNLTVAAALACAIAATAALASDDLSLVNFKAPASADAGSFSDEIAGDVIGTPKPKPLPTDPQWTRIAPGEFHVLEMAINGWTVFSLTAADENSVISVYIYDGDWNTLTEFDSTGCGAFLQLEPQNVTVVLHNTSRTLSNKYVLNIY